MGLFDLFGRKQKVSDLESQNRRLESKIADLERKISQIELDIRCIK